MAKKSLEIEMKIAADVSELKRAQIEINDFQRRMQTLRKQIETGLSFNIGAGIGNRLAQIPSLINSSISAYARQEGAEANLAAGHSRARSAGERRGRIPQSPRVEFTVHYDIRRRSHT